MGRFDGLQRVLGGAWVLVAVALTVALGPTLGARGWAWLIAHHLFLVVVLAIEVARRRSKVAPP